MTKKKTSGITTKVAKATPKAKSVEKALDYKIEKITLYTGVETVSYGENLYGWSALDIIIDYMGNQYDKSNPGKLLILGGDAEDYTLTKKEHDNE